MLVFVSGKLLEKAEALDKERARQGVCQPAGYAGGARSFGGSARYLDAGGARRSASLGGEWQAPATSQCPPGLKEGRRDKQRQAAGH